jgi:Tol biopolymer transport system component/DNA-binding winged helix-turn-helix (wHTH) protein
MLPHVSRVTKLAFGPFEFDPATGELRKHGHKVRLSSQPGQILSALLERPGDLLAREALCRRLWPGATAGDFEHGLNAAVNKLRQALGDAASQPRYVETLSGLGYRFVAPVHLVVGAVLELVPSAAISESEPLPSRRNSPMWSGAVGVLFVLVAAVSWPALHRSPVTPAKGTQFLVVPPQGYYLEGGGVRQSFALSPDGGRLAFTAKDASGAFRLFLRDFSELESHPVSDGEGAYSVVWTSDGQTLLFTAKGKLRRIGLNAGTSQILTDAIPYFTSAIPFGPNRLLVSNHRNSGVISSFGGTPLPIDRSYCWAQSLPGGRDFLYTSDDEHLGSLRARIAPVGGNDSGTEVIQADSHVQYTGSMRSDSGYLIYLRAGTLLAQPFDLAGRHVTAEPRAIARHVASFGPTGAADFSVSRRGVLAYQAAVNRSQFIWVDRTGKHLATAGPAGINASYVRLSPDGRWLAAAPFDVDQGVPEIWLYDTTSGAGRKVITGPAISHLPVWSPDSRRLVYLSDRNWPRLALFSLDGTPDKGPLPDTGFMAPTDWSADSRFILYNNSALPAVTHDFPSDVFAIDMGRNRKVIPLLTTPFYENNAVFSPDGKWLAFLSDESGQAEIYMQALDRSNDSLRVTGERFLISRQGGQCLRWRKDGQELYYLGSDGRVYAVKVNFRAGTVNARRPEPLFTIDAEARATNHSVVSFDVSADGSRFVIPSMTPGERSALVVLQDWESLVAK